MWLATERRGSTGTVYVNSGYGRSPPPAPQLLATPGRADLLDLESTTICATGRGLQKMGMSVEWLWWCNMRGKSLGQSGTEICSVKATIVQWILKRYQVPPTLSSPMDFTL